MKGFTHVSEKLSHFFNKKDLGVHLKENDAYSFRNINELEPFYTWLCYESYDPESHLYHNKNSIGFVLLASPMLGASEDTIDILHSIIVDALPEGSTADFMLWASPKIGFPLEEFYQYRSRRGDIYERLAYHRMKYLLRGAFGSLIQDSAYLVRDFHILMTVSIPKHHEYTEEQLMSLRDNILSTAKSIHLDAKIITVFSFISILRDLIIPNFDPYSSVSEWNPYESLSRQITGPEFNLKVHQDHLSINDSTWEIRSLHPTRYPKQWSQWAMSDLIGDLYKESQRIPCPFVLKLSVHILNRSQSEKRTTVKGARAHQLANSKVAMLMPRAKKISANWKLVSECFDEGDCLVGLMFQVILYAPHRIADQAENSAKKLFLSKGWTLKKSNLIQLPCWLASLPMMLGDGMIQDMRYFNLIQTKLGYNAVNMLPLQGEWKGMNKPLLCFTGRRGQILWWDPFENDEGNYNVAVAGKSGSGKSVFLQEIETAIVGAGGSVFVIDVGRSSEKTCRLLNGLFIEFNPETKISLNPFTQIKDFKESLSMLKPMLALMAAPTRKTTDFENALIEQALVSAWSTLGNNAEITDVAVYLLHHPDPRAQDLGTMLFPYTKEGSYGHFFTGPCTLNFDNPFVNLELEELKSKKDLQEVVLYLLMYHITETMYRGDRKKRIACVIDEAWDIFRGEQGGSFIETGYRRARKYQCLFISGTQGVNDYYKNAATIAAFENSDWVCLLSQKPESIKQLKNTDRFMVDGNLERLLNSVKTIQGEYSEVFIKGPNCHAVGRLMLDPFSRLLYTSKGDEYAALKALTERGMSVSEAIEALSGETLQKAGDQKHESRLH